MSRTLVFLMLVFMTWSCVTAEPQAGAQADRPWVVYEGKKGPGKGKHIVFVTGDEEYRSEEGMPQMARILAERHGFKCTVLFAINKQTGEIDPEQIDNIPGLENLKTADLMVLFIRWRDLPDDQMKHIVDYTESGRPIVALRTATHPFNFKQHTTYIRYNWNYAGPEYTQGFGRQVLGETWIAHHGAHGKESTRGIIAPDATDHPIVRGIRDGDIWGPTDVYTVRLPLPGDSRPLVLGQVLAGMKPDDPPITGPKNEPMMPIAWTKSYTGAAGKTGRVFTTTMGSSTDLESEGLRRLLVNAVYWAVGLEKQIPAQSDVRYVGEYQPTPFRFGGHKKGVKPGDLQ
jgi:type 1 glutamine amidotransferase